MHDTYGPEPGCEGDVTRDIHTASFNRVSTRIEENTAHAVKAPSNFSIEQSNLAVAHAFA
jgi:hypothetical protein